MPEPAEKEDTVIWPDATIRGPFDLEKTWREK
jgi:hypothetical protein